LFGGSWPAVRGTDPSSVRGSGGNPREHTGTIARFTELRLRLRFLILPACSAACRVGAPSFPGTPPTEPDLWAHIRLFGMSVLPTAFAWRKQHWLLSAPAEGWFDIGLRPQLSQLQLQLCRGDNGLRLQLAPAPFEPQEPELVKIVRAHRLVGRR
jgi:hypothetical protein